MSIKSIKKNAALNITKQVCTIIFPLITFPYATRILHADNYGMYVFSSSIISYISLIAALGINNYAVREGARVRNDKEKSADLINRIFTINIVSTILAYLSLFVLMIFWQKLNSYQGLLLILSSSVLFTTIGTDWINVIHEDYSYITKRYIICQLISIILLFALVRDQEDTIWYAFTTIIGGVIAIITNIFYIRKKYAIKLKLSFGRKTWEHLIPILVLFANAIAVTIYIHSDTTILGVFKGDYDVGIYGVSSRIYLVIKQVANAGIYVIIPRISSMINTNKMREIQMIYKKTLGGVLSMLIPALIGLASLSREIITLIAGDEFSAASQPLIILSFSLIFATAACLYINGILIPFRKERVVLLLTIASAAINIVLNIILIPKLSYVAASITTLVSEMIMCIFGIILSKRICKISIKRDLVLGIVSGAIVFSLCALFKTILNHNLQIIACSVLSSAIMYIGIMCAAKDNIVYSTIINFISRIRKNRKNNR